MRVCSVEGCPIAVRSRGWCAMHYQRWRLHGDVNHERPGRMACSVEGCEDDRQGLGLCRSHYDHQRKFGSPDGPPCWDCSADASTCPTHAPPVCVCDVPEPGPMTGQCARCYRPFWVRAEALDMPAVREAWRQFLADEGVYDLHVATGVDA